MRTFRIGIIGVLLGGLLVSSEQRSVFAQGEPQAPVFSSRTELVLLNVMVRDSKDRPVSGLSQESFRVFDNGRPQALQFFMPEDAPVTIGVLIDNSGSMQPNRGLVTTAAARFVETSNSQDEIFALAFNDNIAEVLPPETPFTSDAGVLRDHLLRAVRPEGRTALYNAVTVGLQYLERGTHLRKVLVVVSDGDDTASATTADELMAGVQASNVVVYAVGLFDPVEPHRGWKFLERLTEMTGGRAYKPDNVREVADALQQVAHDIRAAYTLAYAPQGAAGNAMHRTRVLVQTPEGRRLNARTRTAYVAGARPATAVGR